MKTFFAVLALCLSACFALPTLAETSSEPRVTVNINSASAAEIAETLNGVGAAKAEAIVAYREEQGKFESLDALTQVKGIGAATVEKNRDRIQLQ